MPDVITTARVYDYVALHIRRHGYPPTVRQISGVAASAPPRR